MKIHLFAKDSLYNDTKFLIWIDGPVHDGIHVNQLISCVKTAFLDENDLGNNFFVSKFGFDERNKFAKCAATLILV